MIPRLPAHAATWIIWRVCGREAIESAWVAVWSHGAISGALAGMLAVVVLNLILVNAYLLSRRQ